MSRSVIAAGNWKMNKLPSEAIEFVKELKDRVKDASTKIIIGVPFVALDGVVRESTVIDPETGEGFAKLIKKGAWANPDFMTVDSAVIKCKGTPSLYNYDVVSAKHTTIDLSDKSAVHMSTGSYKKAEDFGKCLRDAAEGMTRGTGDPVGQRTFKDTKIIKTK